MADVSVPRPKAPQVFVDKDGRLTRESFIFVSQLWERTGGATDAVGGGLLAVNNLSDVDSAGNSRVNLGFTNGILDKTAPGNIGTVTPGNGTFATTVGTSATFSTTLTVTGKFFVDALNNVAVGTAALATTATDGFLYIPTTAGPPTGTPTAKTGLVPMVYDTTNKMFYIYNGAWESVLLA